MSLRDSKRDIYMLNQRFVKDYGLSIDKGIAGSDYFYDRLSQYELYKPGILEKYNNFLDEIEELFNSAEEYYCYRNQTADEVITDLCNNEDKYGYSGNDGAKLIKERFPKFKKDITGNSYLKEINIGKTLISIDLKSANFTALKAFDKKIVNNKDSYEEFIADYTDMNHIKESKYFRQRVFGKSGVSQQVEIEKSITGKILEILLRYIPENLFLTYAHDELVFEKNKDFDIYLDEILKEIQKLDIKIHLEEFKIFKILGTENGYLKRGKELLTNETIFKIYGVSSVMFVYVLAELFNTEIKDSYTYFVNNEGYLSKFIEIPKITIKEDF